MSEEWKQGANCIGMPPYWFFEGYEQHQQEVDEACENCIVRKECLEYGIEHNVEGGVFGRRYFGSTSKDKSRMRRSPDRKISINEEEFVV